MDDPAEDIALLTGLPVDIVRVGLDRLMVSGTFVYSGRAVECPNFIDGQTASKSDSVRCREYRARLKSRRELSRECSTDTKSVATNTDCVTSDTKSVAPTRERPATTQRDPARPVIQHPIPSHPISNTDTSRSPAGPIDRPIPFDATERESTLPDVPPVPQPKKRTKTVNATASAGETEVFEHWKRVMGKASSTEFSPKRLRAVRARLDSGRTVKELCRAVDGCARSDFNMGREPGKPSKYNDLELICRDAEHFERFLELAGGNGSGGALRRLDPGTAEAWLQS